MAGSPFRQQPSHLSVYTQPMRIYKQRYLELKPRWKEYYLQVQLRKARRIILLCACVLCLFARKYM